MILSTLCYLRRNDGAVLMMHRNRRENDLHHGKWNGLGGKFQPGESPEECVIREVHEESGLLLQRPLLRGVLTWPLFDGKEDWMAFVFTGTDYSGRLADQHREGELAWIPESEVLSRPLWEGDRVFLRWLLEGRFFSGKFVYSDGRLVSHTVHFHDSIEREGRTEP